MGKLIFKIFIIIFCIILLQGVVAFASTKNVKISIERQGKFVTNVKGIGRSQPPYLRVVRSKNGVSYLFNKFRKIRNVYTHSKALSLEKKMLAIDFKSKMIIAILSFPTDNFQFENIKIIEMENEQKIEVILSYLHKNIDYSIPPFKSIFYRFYVVKLSDFPVVLSSNLLQDQNSGKKKKTIKISGTLQKWGEKGDQLALVNKSRRKKRVYYIKGKLRDKLSQHVGQFMALKGEVTLDSESIYESDFLVKAIVKIY